MQLEQTFDKSRSSKKVKIKITRLNKKQTNLDEFLATDWWKIYDLLSFTNGHFSQTAPKYLDLHPGDQSFTENVERKSLADEVC